jgi:hypothetical protein
MTTMHPVYPSTIPVNAGKKIPDHMRSLCREENVTAQQWVKTRNPHPPYYR